MKSRSILPALLVSLSVALPGAAAVEASSEQVQQSESAKANQLFEQIFEQGVMRSPMTQTYLGIKKDYDRWDDLSEQRELEELAIAKENLAKLKKIDINQLDEQTRLSYALMQEQLQNEIDDFKWRLYNYPVNQMYGMHSMPIALLMNQHPLQSKADADAFIARVEKLDELFVQLIEGLERRAKEGIMAPKFVYNYVISDSKNMITGAPFEKGEDSPLFAYFKKKVEGLDMQPAEKTQLVERLKAALLKDLLPGYKKLIAYVKDLQQRADTRDGVWKFSNGDEFYNVRLKRITTTDLTAEQIHQIGLSEVKRIHGEMRAIMKKVGFKGSLQEFFSFMRDDPRFYYPNNDQGREAYLKQAEGYIEQMNAKLDELFGIKPKAGLLVKRVEPFREKSAGKAFYNQPSLDGKRPGIFYANLYNMKDMPKYQLEALAYHEGIPGHHMQIAIAQELEGIPKFRRFGRYTAYVEGWGLYSELVPKEIGFYEDPYSDFGRLAMELWRACRLVVDTGIHAKRWTREQGIKFYMDNTPNSKGDVVKMVERHIVMPGQATAYKIGMLKILELREKSKQQLGDKFDIREFHDVVLKNGPLPLSVLENIVEQYIASKRGA